MSKSTQTFKITINSVISRNPGQQFSKIDGEVVMLSLNAGEYLALNDSASRIWDLLDQPQRVSELIRILTEEYQIDFEECKSDTLSCLADFGMKSIIEISN